LGGLTSATLTQRRHWTRPLEEGSRLKGCGFPGCDSEFSVGSPRGLVSHRAVCPHRPIPCPARCGALLARHLMAMHVARECRLRPIEPPQPPRARRPGLYSLECDECDEEAGGGDARPPSSSAARGGQMHTEGSPEGGGSQVVAMLVARAIGKVVSSGARQDMIERALASFVERTPVPPPVKTPPTRAPSGRGGRMYSARRGGKAATRAAGMSVRVRTTTSSSPLGGSRGTSPTATPTIGHGPAAPVAPLPKFF
jgi:hypothetical protein